MCSVLSDVNISLSTIKFLKKSEMFYPYTGISGNIKSRSSSELGHKQTKRSPCPHSQMRFTGSVEGYMQDSFSKRNSELDL